MKGFGLGLVTSPDAIVVKPNPSEPQDRVQELERMRDELLECIKRAQKALERTEMLIRTVQDETRKEALPRSPPMPPPE